MTTARVCPPLWFGAIGSLGLAAALLLSSATAFSQEQKPQDQQPPEGREKAEQGTKLVPLKKVVLFNAGVGFFEHRGTVEGDAQIDLRFNVEDINDLLKSMVLQDADGGNVASVTYGSRDPITRALKTFAIDLTTTPTLAQILNQIRGEAVELDIGKPLTGTIIGVETREKPAGEQTVEFDVLNLLTSTGLRSVPLENVLSIKILNKELDDELRAALAVLAKGHDTDKKTVTLNFKGEGKRQVAVGYIQETPVWKTSYRLVLDDDKAPFLQGWAIVENTTEEDWNDVRLSLISGRPISFIMDLYQPLYVDRPVVEPELYASLRPQTYGQDLEAKEQEFRKQANRAAAAPPGAAKAAAAADEKAAGFSQRRYDVAARGRGLERDAAKLREAEQQLSLQQGVQSAAQAANVGEMFKYEIQSPVTLQRQRSAMLPIVNEEVKGAKVSIYNQNVHAKHPLHGLKLVNSTNLHLMQGPITVFDDSAYAGDARIEDLPPGSERLISYAMDLDTEVAPAAQSGPEVLTSVSIVRGTLNTTRKYSRMVTYTIKNSGKETRNLLIEHPFDPNWTLVTPKEPAEKTRDMYRFAVSAEPGKPQAFVITEERVQGQSIFLTNVDDNMIGFYISSKVVSEPIKEALREVIKRKQDLAQVVVQRNRLQQQINVIGEEQARIRQNMAQIDKNTDLYNRYLKKFTEQEDQIEKHRAEIEKLNAEEAKLRKALDDYLINLTLQ